MDTPTGSPRTTTPRRGDVIELTVDDWGHRGRGVARAGRMVVLTDRGLPGDQVRVRITGRRKQHLEATVEEILSPSPHRVTPPCRHFGLCGGCRLLDLEYGQQLKDKVRHLTEQLRRIGKLASIPSIDVIPCDPPYRYRNKMEFSFGGTGGAVHLGLHPRENFREAFDLEECWLTDERAAQIVAAVRAFFADGPEGPHDPLTHIGFLRFLVVRFGSATGDVLVNLVTADAEWPRADAFGVHLQKTCPFITTALWTINDRRANVAMGDVRQVFFGPGNFRERLGAFEFEIAPGGFFQTNTSQALQLFSRAVDFAAPDGGDVLDLYSGAGAISLFLSGKAAHVTGVESYRESVTTAGENAARSGIENCTFICADVLDFLREHAESGFFWPTVIVDPPRAGLHPKVIKVLRKTNVSRIVYVSCNTAALARDLALFGEQFRLVELVAVDMFPHTPHIEAVALLERKTA